ncbi:MAG: hypothetical protein ACRDPO_25970, partial [Streptosporangiaceae bacterium]
MTAGELAGPDQVPASAAGGAVDGIDVSTAAGLARSLADLMRASHHVMMSVVGPGAARVGAHLV